MELSPTQKASLLDRDMARGGIAMLLSSHKARIIRRFFRRTSCMFEDFEEIKGFFCSVLDNCAEVGGKVEDIDTSRMKYCY
jgi:hypothetical protein